MKAAEPSRSFHVRVSDDVIIRRCNTVIIDAPDSLAAIEIARRRAIMGEIDMRGNGDETYTPFSFQIIEPASKTGRAIQETENEERMLKNEMGMMNRE